MGHEKKKGRAALLDPPAPIPPLLASYSFGGGILARRLKTPCLK